MKNQKGQWAKTFKKTFFVIPHVQSDKKHQRQNSIIIYRKSHVKYLLQAGN